MLPGRTAGAVDHDRHPVHPGLEHDQGERLERRGRHRHLRVTDDVPLVGLVDHPGDDDVGVGVELHRDRPDQRQGQRSGVPLLVGRRSTRPAFWTPCARRPDPRSRCTGGRRGRGRRPRVGRLRRTPRPRGRGRSAASRPRDRCAPPAARSAAVWKQKASASPNVPRNTGRYRAGSSCAAGCSTAGTGTLPMAATVGWYR